MNNVPEIDFDLAAMKAIITKYATSPQHVADFKLFFAVTTIAESYEYLQKQYARDKEQSEATSMLINIIPRQLAQRLNLPAAAILPAIEASHILVDGKNQS